MRIPLVFLCFIASNIGHAAEFVEQVQPILTQHCLECHGPEKQRGSFRLDLKAAAFKGGDSGPAIIPGDSSSSTLITHITAPAGDDLAMPPKGPRLPAEDVALLRAWIDQGALWPDELAGADTRLDHWSVKPLPKSTTPPHSAPNPIDAFIASKLQQANLSPAPPADARTLIRRLHFTLTGLPPDPAAVEAFARQPDPAALEHLVDQLLASPHYGERWARHWLDIAHYADTHGFERDQLRPNAWRYRDYVIDAFNQDKPYDQFLREQIAGDALPSSQTPALGFLAAGPWDFVGHVETKSDLLKRAARAGDLDDIITQVLTSTMGITINCARCHDHKLDPISQQEYYRLWAVFAGVKRGDTDVEPAESQRIALEKKRLSKQLDETRSQIATLAGEGLELATLIPPNSGIDLRNGKLTTEKLGYHRDLIPNKEIPVPSIPAIRSVFIPNGPAPIPTTSGHFWDSLANRPLTSQRTTTLGGIDFASASHTLLAMHANSGITFDLAKLREQSGFHSMRLTGWVGFGASAAAAASKADFTVLIDGTLSFQKLKLRKDETATLDIAIPAQAKTLSLIATDGGDGISNDLLFIGDPKLLPEVTEAHLSKAKATQLKNLRATAATLEAALNALPDPAKVYAIISETQPPVIKVQRRGNPEDEAQEVTPGAFAWTRHAPPDFGDHSTPDAQRRLALANWITHPDNPLTARVIVNRLWHHHFGQGLVTTPSDFGLGGDPPSHPELLDFLAHELITHGWSLKHIHKLIVMSRTYQQKSVGSLPSNGSDGSNRLLSRQNPRRLDAETLRDTVLSLSGKLNLQRGGPGYRDFDYTEAYAPIYRYTTPDKPELWRRSIYRFVVRTTPHQFMSTLDCPDPANFTPARAQTTTALQALALSNNEFMLQQARFLADRIHHETQAADAAITRAFQLCFQRSPTPEELAAAKSLDLFTLCRMLMNANEFIYVD